MAHSFGLPSLYILYHVPLTDHEVVVFGGNKHVARDTGSRNAVTDTCIIQLGKHVPPLLLVALLYMYTY